MAKYERNACPVSCTKHLFVALNVLFLIIGLALVGAGVQLHLQGSKVPDNKNGPDVHDDSGRIAIVLYVLGGFIAVLSFLGCCGAWKRVRCLLVCYLVLLMVVIAAQVAVGLVVYHAAKDSNLDKKLSNTWHSADNDWRNSVQANFDCCGYMNPLDDPGTVCPGKTADNPDAGCYPILKHDLKKALHIVLIVALTVAAIEIFALCSSLTLVCCLNTTRQDPASFALLNSAYEPKPAYRATYTTRA